MGALLLLGCILIGYSVPTALFFMILVRKAQLVIVMLARYKRTARGASEQLCSIAKAVQMLTPARPAHLSDVRFVSSLSLAVRLSARCHVLCCMLCYSAFFWLLALTASSLIWSAIPPLQDSTHGWAIVPVGVILQELARAAFIRLYLSATQTSCCTGEARTRQQLARELNASAKARESKRSDGDSNAGSPSVALALVSCGSLFPPPWFSVVPSVVSVSCRSMQLFFR